MCRLVQCYIYHCLDLHQCLRVVNSETLVAQNQTLAKRNKQTKDKQETFAFF